MVAFGRLYHLRTNAIVGLFESGVRKKALREKKKHHPSLYLSNAGALIRLEPIGDSVHRRDNLCQFRAVQLLRISAKTGNGQHLLIFGYPLLQFAKQDAQSCGVVRCPERIREPGHCDRMAAKRNVALQTEQRNGRLVSGCPSRPCRRAMLNKQVQPGSHTPGRLRQSGKGGWGQGSARKLQNSKP